MACTQLVLSCSSQRHRPRHKIQALQREMVIPHEDIEECPDTVTGAVKVVKSIAMAGEARQQVQLMPLDSPGKYSSGQIHMAL